MNNSESNRNIQKYNNDVKQLKQEMEKVCAYFISAACEFAKMWFNKKIDHAIESKPEIANRFGKEGLKKLKSTLNKLLLEIPGIVDNCLNKNELWIHRQDISEIPLKKSVVYINPELKDNVLYNAVRNVLGPVGTLLIEFGFEDTNPENIWGEKDGCVFLRPRVGYKWTDEMRKHVMNYANLYEKFHKTLLELRIWLDKREKEKAKELWKSVKEEPNEK